MWVRCQVHVESSRSNIECEQQSDSISAAERGIATDLSMILSSNSSRSPATGIREVTRR